MNSDPAGKATTIKARTKLTSQLTRLTPFPPMSTPRKTQAPFRAGHYIRSPQHADEVRRLEIGKVLQCSLLSPLPLTATARHEAYKLLGEAGLLVEDELPTGQLLELYVIHVAPELPPINPFMLDEAV